MVAHFWQAFFKTIAITTSLFLLFTLLEPVVSSASSTGTFTIQQEITPEISLTLGTTTVEMTGPIGGVAGGTATGTNYAVVRSNSPYTLTIAFANDPAMLGDNTGSTAIRDYETATANPDFEFTASTSALFAYTVASEPSADLVGAFKDNSVTCGTGGTDYTANRCWKGPSTTPFTVVDRATSTGTGSATTTFTFVVNVPDSPVPAVPSDFYTATATLTALANS